MTDINANDSGTFKEETITARSHLDADKHWIGEALPAGTIFDATLTIGSSTSVGTSKFPARIDHTHQVDSSLFVAKTGDVMSGSLWTKALSISNVNPLLELWNDAATTRYGYFWGSLSTSTIELAAENGTQLGFRTQGTMRETIDTSGNHWWTGGTNGDAMLFDRGNQMLVIKSTVGSGWEVMRLCGSVPYIGFWNATGAARMGYLQGSAGGINYGIDSGTLHSFVIGGVQVLAVQAAAISAVGAFFSNNLPPTTVWDTANFRAFHNSTASTSQSRLCLYSGTIAPQLRSVNANGERLGVINYNASAYAPIEASAFPVSSSIKTKKNIRGISCKLFQERKTDHHPLLDTVPEPNIMSLRPIAFRPKIGPSIIERADPDVEVDIDNPKSWKHKFRDPKTPLGVDGYRERLGMVAEEVQTVLPSAVSIDEDGNAVGIDYAQVTVALLSHVQQLTDEIVSLRERVAELEDV